MIKYIVTSEMYDTSFYFNLKDALEEYKSLIEMKDAGLIKIYKIDKLIKTNG